MPDMTGLKGKKRNAPCHEQHSNRYDYKHLLFQHRFSLILRGAARVRHAWSVSGPDGPATDYLRPFFCLHRFGFDLSGRALFALDLV
jgi:hypothetical protein